MRIKVIKANTNKNTLKTIDKVAKKYARPGTEIITVCPERGPLTIEDHYDETLAVVKVLEGLIDCGKRTSKISVFRFPEPKAVTGYPDTFKLKFGEKAGFAGT